MNWGQFKDLVSHMCLAGAVLACWSLTQEVAVLSPFTVMRNIFVTGFREHLEKTQIRISKYSSIIFMPCKSELYLIRNFHH